MGWGGEGDHLTTKLGDPSCIGGPEGPTALESSAPLGGERVQQGCAWAGGVQPFLSTGTLVFHVSQQRP